MIPISYVIIALAIIGLLNLLLASSRLDHHTWPSGRIDTREALVEVALANVLAGAVAMLFSSCLVQFVL